jgi:hypothetical protein
MESLSLYVIECIDDKGSKFPDYIDPFTGDIFKDTKTKASMVCFMLNDQRPGFQHKIKELEK